MARVILGLGTSHSPQLQLPPDEWPVRAAADRRNQRLFFRGHTYAFPELLELRADEHFEREIIPEKAQARWDACQRAIAQLGRTLEEAAPDAVVVIGDDEHELFLDDNLPATCVFYGAEVEDAPPEETEQDRRNGLYTTPIANAPAARVTHPGEPSLGRHLVESLVESGFDVAASQKLPAGSPQGSMAHPLHTVGHAFHFVYRRLMHNEVIPHVPIFMNTYFPPNQPTMRRCYELGQALRHAIESWYGSQRVAVIASGGLSHFVIEEDLDHHIIDGLKQSDAARLTDLPDSRFNSGTSEIRNWIVLGGVMAGDGLSMELVDYVPCYRSEAGTGCAMTFASWK